MIVEILQQEVYSLLSWSSTCTFYRSLLAPYVFKDIHFRNTRGSSASVIALANSEHCSHVKTLDLTYTFPYIKDESEEDDVDDETEDDDKGLTKATYDDDPESVCTILSDLGRFPHLQSFSLECCLDQEFEYQADLGIFYMFEDDENTYQATEAEMNVPWRAQMGRVYTSLVRNTRSPVKVLEIRNLMPREATAWSTPAFQSFLGRLECFKLSLMGGDNGAGWCFNTLDGYTAFPGKLAHFFFNSLTNVTELTFKPDETGPVGLVGWRHCDLSLHAKQMPSLKTLFLENIFICPELVEFLVGHADTLERVLLHNCFAGVGGLAENGIYWERLFILWADSNPQALQHVEILPFENIFENEYGNDKGGEYHEELTRTRKMLEEDPNRRHFEYRYLDDKYGIVFRDDPETRSTFFEGHDQQAYDRLMKIVKRNNERYTRTLTAPSEQDMLTDWIKIGC